MTFETNPEYPMLAVSGVEGTVVANGQRVETGDRVAMVRVQSPDGAVETATLALEPDEDFEDAIEHAYWETVEGFTER